MSNSTAASAIDDTEQSIVLVKKIKQLKEALDSLPGSSAESAEISELIKRMETNASNTIASNVRALHLLVAPIAEKPTPSPAPEVSAALVVAEELPGRIGAATDGLMTAIKQITGAASKMVMSAESMKLKITREALVLAVIAGATAGLVMAGASAIGVMAAGHPAPPPARLISGPSPQIPQPVIAAAPQNAVALRMTSQTSPEKATGEPSSAQ